MIALVDIGNTHTHVALADGDRPLRRIRNIPTSALRGREGRNRIQEWLGRSRPRGACLCSVVPGATVRIRELLGVPTLQLDPSTLRGVTLDYPRPGTIGQDRLANAVAARHHFGAPVVVVDFGTAVTFDVVDRRGCYVGGIIAPGLAAMTDYLHDKTALLPRIRLIDPGTAIGRSTRQAMQVGAVHGYRGLVRELIVELRRELRARRLPVVATGGYAGLIARGLPAITHVREHLTLEGLRLTWTAHNPCRPPIAD